MDFAWKIIGQTKIINNLIDLKNRDILPNSFIFSGPNGIGKRTLALEFAKFLKTNNVAMYSAYWCPHCHDQKQLFGQKAVKELIVIECAKDGKDSKFELCKTKGIEGFPSWEINGEIYSGVIELNDLAVMTGYEGDSNF